MKVNKTDDVVGVTLIGLGRVGKVHLKNVQANPRLEPLWLVDVDQDLLDSVFREHFLSGGASKCRHVTIDNIEPALRDPRVGMILILTPTDTHPVLIETCIERSLGQPIFCEKPISVDTDQILRCYKLAKEAEVQLMCGFNRRFDPTYRRLIEMVKSEGGQIQSINATLAACPSPTCHFLKQCHSSRNGVIFYDTGTHFVDLILWLLDDELPKSVHSIGHSFTDQFKECDEPDLTMSTLRFKSGACVTVELGYVSSVKFDMRMEVRCAGGLFQADNPAATGVVSITPRGALRDPLPESLWERYRESYRNELDFMADVAQGKESVSLSGEHCAKVADVVEAMRKSFYENRVVIL